MTFEYAPETIAARDAARTAARALAASAETIDARGQLPAGAADAVPFGPDAVTLVTAVEELAVSSAAVAIAAALGGPARPLARPLPGLRGAACGEWEPVRGRLVLAAAALGVGRAALELAIRALAESRPGTAQRVEKPHWQVSDAATALEAARLLLLKAADAVDRGSEGLGESAVAKLMAATAAAAAVDAALAMLGPEAYAAGSALDRLSRDARSLALLMGTDEELRVVAAETVLGRG